MKHRILDKDCKDEVTGLFTSVFTSSEGEIEGKLLGKLVSQLAAKIDNQEIIGFAACEEQSIIGAIFFTRLRFNNPIRVYMLSPVAVSTGHQRRGVGQALISYGIKQMKNRSVAVVITYGDPSFYSRVGFSALSENVIRAPLKLSMPEGWLGQSLTGKPIPTINDHPECVKEFNDPVYW